MPLNDIYNLVPLTHDEVRGFAGAGSGNALFPRLWEVPPGEGTEIDGTEIAAVDGKPTFFVGTRKPPKSVVSFGLGWTWLRACMFLNPGTLQCHTYDTEFYPDECAEYPGYNLVLERETECERVERYHGGERLPDNAAPGDLHGLFLGPHALGVKPLVYPESEQLAGIINHLKRRGLTSKDRTQFVGAVVGLHPGLTEVDGDRALRACAKTLESESWAGGAIAVWDIVAGRLGSVAGDASDPDEVEVAHSVPETPGRDAVRDGG